MIKKIRKKKEVEFETYDILQLDEKIKKLIQEESRKLDKYILRTEEIKKNLSKNSHFNYREKKELEEELQKLEIKINDIETNTMFSEYVCVTQKIISEYMELLNVPKNVSFFKKTNNHTENDDKKEILLEQFLEIAKNYIPIRNYKKETQKKIICEDCNNFTDFIYTENTITCENCGMEQNIYTIQTNFKDIDRVNLSQKYKYSKRVYFRETVNRFEGKQNKKINQQVYDDIEKWFEKHNLLDRDQITFHERHSKITKEHMYMALSETGHNLHYEDINLLHNQFTGLPCPDISYIRNELFEDFDKVMSVYESIDVERVNSLNSQYILYQLLRRRKVKVNENDFGMLKTRDRLIDYDEIYQKICHILEWTFIPTV